MRIVTKSGDTVTETCCEQANVKVADDVLFRLRMKWREKGGESRLIVSPLLSTERKFDDEQVVRAWYCQALEPKLGSGLKWTAEYLLVRRKMWPGKGYVYKKPKFEQRTLHG
jgi:hypothetical protein